MDLAELEIFRAVALEQSVTRAARSLDRVQSNVTTRVKQLEEELGVALFLRDSKRMTLTPEGQRFLAYAEQLLALAEEARQSMRRDVPTGKLRVGSMESSAASRLPRPLARYHGKWPDVQIEIQTGTTQALIDSLLAHRLDCAVVAHPAEGTPATLDMDVLGPGLEGAFLFTEELLLVLPPGHPPVRAPQDILPRSLATFARGCTYRMCAEAWLAGGAETPRPAPNMLELASYHAILACVAAGSAVAILPRSLLALHPDATALQTVPVRTAHTFLVRRSGFITSAYEAFLQELQRG
ncbi:LysR family transcriptional regulator [Cupriavidus basilensis]|uniref:LysR family transcriptional regulator n=1 Tax=Cupriavidus basilensis TaxID=68895 RepID=A0ABT6AXU0_9BURK|nr:LysR family transcriptional regulator [Cupriavidus basilensis]MDF3837434.1 LysR family transcriptional regulator [Cupriavidus basilensis]